MIEGLKRIRFLTLSIYEFSRLAARSDLLSSKEKVALFINISDPVTDFKMPNGFSMNRIKRWNNPMAIAHGNACTNVDALQHDQ